MPRDCAIRSEHFLALVLALASPTAGAQDADARLKALESQVERLTQRLDKLEGRSATPAPPQLAPCPGVDRLRMSMTEAEVRSVLGAPVKIDSTPLQDRWRYSCGTAYIDVQTRRFVGFER